MSKDEPNPHVVATGFCSRELNKCSPETDKMIDDWKKEHWLFIEKNRQEWKQQNKK